MLEPSKFNGWLNLHKPPNITSAKAVYQVRKALNSKKIGHAGTLDPLAHGVLPLAIGEATKTIQFCMNSKKTYEFTIQWGIETATGDIEGKITNRSDVRPSESQIAAILGKFTGEIWQKPPIYSAIKINGKRACDLARNGQDVDIAKRKIHIYELELIDHSVENNTSSFRVLCSKGTYIRSLGQDIAKELGTFAHIIKLFRTKVGIFSIKDAILLEDIEKTVYKDSSSDVLFSVDSVLDDIQVLEFTSEETTRIRHGQRLKLEELQLSSLCLTATFSGNIIAKCNGKLVAICEYGNGILKPSRVFKL